MNRERHARRSRPAARIAVALGLMLTLGLTSISLRAQSAAPMQVQGIAYQSSAEGFAIHITAGGATARQKPGEVLLSFRKAAPALDARDLAERGKPWLVGVNAGYDQLLLLTAPGVRVQIHAVGDDLEVLLTSSPAAAEEASVDVQGARRLALLRAQLQLRQGHLAEARRQLEVMRAEQPQDPEVIAGLASVAEQAGRWRQALELFRESGRYGGDSLQMTNAIEAIERETASRASIDGEHLHVSGGEYAEPVTEDLVSMSGFKRLSETWGLGASGQTVDVSSALLQRSDGRLGSFSGRRARSQLDLEHDAFNGSATVGSLFESRGRAGAGVSHQIADDWGQTRVGAEWQRPYWDLVEGAVDAAVRDRVWFGRSQRLQDQVRGELQTGLNRYDEPIQSGVARSLTVLADLRMDALGGIPGVAAVYHLDAEFVRSRALRRGANGVAYFPLPLQNREVHSVTLGYAKSLFLEAPHANLTFDGYAGFAKVGDGAGGPLAAAVLKYSVRHVELQFHASLLRGVGSAGAVDRTLGVLVSLRP